MTSISKYTTIGITTTLKFVCTLFPNKFQTLLNCRVFTKISLAYHTYILVFLLLYKYQFNNPNVFHHNALLYEYMCINIMYKIN